MGNVKSTQDFYIKMLHLTNNAKKLNFSPLAKMKIYTLSKAPLAHKTNEALHMDLLCNYFKWSLKAKLTVDLKNSYLAMLVSKKNFTHSTETN